MQLIVPVVAMLAWSAGCADEPDNAVPMGGTAEAAAAPSPEVQAALEAGNEAYRADDYAGALEHYQRATELAPELAAGWFGVSMAQEALGNEDAAADAMAKSMELAPQGGEMGQMPMDSTHAGMAPATMPADSVHGATGG